MKEKIIGVMGFGEIGRSVAQVYPKNKFKILSKDLDHDFLDDSVDVLHIAIPYDENFIQDVVKQIKICKPKFVIIESTVDVGVTSKINKLLKNKIVVHSPVRGKHPNLTKSIKTFVKFVGADDKKIGEDVVKHYKAIGVDAKCFVPSTATELNKILCTSYYGLCIAWAHEVNKICEKFGVDYSTFEEFNDTYNEGYKKMHLPNVIRPTLTPPKNGIGGHCVWENAVMFNKKIKSKYFDLIIDLGKDKNAKTLKLRKK